MYPFFSAFIIEPNGNEHCTFTYGNTQWLNDRCDARRPFTCSGEKLILVKENKTWEDALNHCSSLGGVNSRTNIYNLATLKTEVDHNYAQELAQQATTDEVGQVSTLCWCLTSSISVFMWMSPFSTGVDGPEISG